MREILFRGKTTKDKEWVYGDLLHDGYDYDVAIWEQKYKLVTEISPETVGQFTGLTDKNGTKIFEGDIVRNGEYTMIVVWYDFLASFALAFSVDGNYHETMSKSDGYLEVIGNIHDNPELLEATT